MPNRELIDTGIDKRYVRRDDKGQFKESDDVGNSLAADRRTKAKTVAKHASRGRDEYDQVGGTRETARGEGAFSRGGRQGGFGEERQAAHAARKQDTAESHTDRTGAPGAPYIGKETPKIQ